MTRILLLGGTTEASSLARKLAAKGLDAVFSYAGRTDDPVQQPLPTRIGGFGGISGLADYLRFENISHLIDATHPFAAGMSRNAIAAAELANIPLCALERAPWTANEADAWTHVANIPAAEEPTRIFLAIGRQNLAPFAAKPWHQYLLRFVDPPICPVPLAGAEHVIARGPFTEADDLKLLKTRRIKLIVAKNSGGSGARAKLDAARVLGLPVIMIDRPAMPTRLVVHDVAAVLAWIGHSDVLGV